MPKRRNRSKQADPADLPALAAGPDFSIRAAQEIPKPKDWQALQRGCVILFQAELKDLHAQEYGRNGQKQRGIDVLGRRNGNPDHFVGIQCRRLDKPMKKDKILADCRAALSIKAGLKEIIFATTCPSDVNATNAAIDVERELRAEGHDLKVVLHSWSDLELKIAQHPTAYAFFFPSAVATTATQSSAKLDPDLLSAIADAVAARQSQVAQDPPLQFKEMVRFDRIDTLDELDGLFTVPPGHHLGGKQLTFRIRIATQRHLGIVEAILRRLGKRQQPSQLRLVWRGRQRSNQERLAIGLPACQSKQNGCIVDEGQKVMSVGESVGQTAFCHGQHLIGCALQVLATDRSRFSNEGIRPQSQFEHGDRIHAPELRQIHVVARQFPRLLGPARHISLAQELGEPHVRVNRADQIGGDQRLRISLP
jgi:hypothetical protein